MEFTHLHLHLGIVKELLKQGANINLHDINGYSVLMLASKYSYGDVVNMLIENGADHTIRNTEDGTFLDVGRWSDEEKDKFRDLIGLTHSEYIKYI